MFDCSMLKGCLCVFDCSMLKGCLCVFDCSMLKGCLCVFDCSMLKGSLCVTELYECFHISSLYQEKVDGQERHPNNTPYSVIWTSTQCGHDPDYTTRQSVNVCPSFLGILHLNYTLRSGRG